MSGVAEHQPLPVPVHGIPIPPLIPHSDDASYLHRGRTASNYRRHGIVEPLYNAAVPDEGRSRHWDHRALPREFLSVPRSNSRQSTSSGRDGSPRRGGTTPEVDTQSEASDRPSSILGERKDEFGLTIEEVSENDLRDVSCSRIVQPDGYSEAPSENGASPLEETDDDITKRMKKMYCTPDDRAEERRAKIQRQKERRKRWSARTKRTWSESCDSDADEPDETSFQFDDVGSSAYRVKRRRSEQNERPYPDAEDKPPDHITEAEESDDGLAVIDAPPSYAELEWNGLRAMPFYELPDPMRVDSEVEFYSAESEEED